MVEPVAGLTQQLRISTQSPGITTHEDDEPRAGARDRANASAVKTPARWVGNDNVGGLGLPVVDIGLNDLDAAPGQVYPGITNCMAINFDHHPSASELHSTSEKPDAAVEIYQGARWCSVTHRCVHGGDK